MKLFRLPILLLFSFIVFISCSTESTPIYQLTTNSEPAEAGTVTPSNSEYDEGEQIQITATENEHWVFSGWQGDAIGSSNPATITMDSDKNITAVFVKRDYPLTVNTEGQGSVTEAVVQTRTTDYSHGTVVELIANPDNGWEFVEWQGDLTGSENPATIEIVEETTVTAVFTLSDDSDPVVNLSVNWNDLELIVSSNSKQKGFSADEANQITHFGARLVYVQENAVFAQSVERSGESDQGLITLEVPPTDEAFLFATAVNVSGEAKAILLGTLGNISMEPGTVYDWSIDSIDWIVPEWSVVDSLAEAYESGVIVADKDESKFELILKVTDPFHPFLEELFTEVSYDDSIIRLNGTGGMFDFDAESGLRDFRFDLSNPLVGTESTQTYDNIFPRLDGQRFNLPSAQYVVFDKINVDISWE